MTSMSLRLPVVLKERIMLKAFSLGLSGNEYLRALAEQHMGDELFIPVEEPEPEPLPEVVEDPFHVATNIHPDCDHPSSRRVGTWCHACHRDLGESVI